MISLRGGGWRKAFARPITTGATIMMPGASDASQCCQVVQIGAVGLWNNLKATVPPTPGAAAATTAAVLARQCCSTLGLPRVPSTGFAFKARKYPNPDNPQT
jgi:hypothetical protein